MLDTKIKCSLQEIFKIIFIHEKIATQVCNLLALNLKYFEHENYSLLEKSEETHVTSLRNILTRASREVARDRILTNTNLTLLC